LNKRLGLFGKIKEIKSRGRMVIYLMKHLIGLYVVMVIMVIVTLMDEFILKGEYSAIASWLIVMLFLFGTICFANARYFLSKR